jgi:septum formation protein
MLILASSSPRRQELLRSAGIAFTVQPADISEIPREGELPRPFAERVAREKALAVFTQRPTDFVLGADTIVVVNGQILGKPRDGADAARMLRLLSSRRHEVTTAVCLLGPSTRSAEPNPGFEDVRSETTFVTVKSLEEEDVLGYVVSGEPMDKAGAYAIQGWASRWIAKVEGDYSNVVGLPLELVKRMLHEHGVIAED